MSKWKVYLIVQLTCSGESQLAADNTSLKTAKSNVADCSILLVVAHLHSPLKAVVSSDKPHVTIGTNPCNLATQRSIINVVAIVLPKRNYVSSSMLFVTSKWDLLD